MVRSILAITTGLLWLIILTNIAAAVVAFLFVASTGNLSFTPGYLIISAIYSVLFALAAGFITASISKETPQRDIAILSFVVFIISIVFLIIRLNQQPIWYALLLIIVIPMAILTGGQIKVNRVRKEEDSRYK